MEEKTYSSDETELTSAVGKYCLAEFAKAMEGAGRISEAKRFRDYGYEYFRIVTSTNGHWGAEPRNVAELTITRTERKMHGPQPTDKPIPWDVKCDLAKF